MVYMLALDGHVVDTVNARSAAKAYDRERAVDAAKLLANLEIARGDPVAARVAVKPMDTGRVDRFLVRGGIGDDEVVHRVVQMVDRQQHQMPRPVFQLGARVNRCD